MSWQTQKLESVADFCLGKMLDQKKNRGEPLPYLANVNVRWGEFDLVDLREMRFEQHELDRYGLKYGDIVMCEGGEPGRCAIWKEQHSSMMIQKALHGFGRMIVSPEFLYYFFPQKGRTGHLSSLFTGSTIKHLPREKLALVEVPVPPHSTQDKIVDVLSAYDNLIENNRRGFSCLSRRRDCSTRNGSSTSASPVMNTPDHRQRTGGVEEKPLGELLTLQRGFDLPVSKRKEGRFPIYASTGINGYHAEAKVKGPGVVTGRSGSLGTVIYISGDFWPLNTTLWVKEFKLVGPHYANHLLANMQLEQYNGGAAVPTLNRNDVHRVEVLSPPSMLLRMFEDQSHDIVKQIDALTSMNLKLAEARDLLLPKLMNGELAV